MSTTGSDAAPAPGAEGVNLLKRNSDDVGWKYGFLVDPNNKDKVKCKFCNKEMSASSFVVHSCIYVCVKLVNCCCCVPV